MKRIFAVIFSVVFSMTCHSQNTTTLTGVVVSESTQVWANGTWVASIVIPGGGGTAKFLDGTSVPPQYSGQLTSGGAFPATTPVVGNVAKIVPTGVTWRYCIYSLTSATPSCFNQATKGTTFNMGNYSTTVISKPFVQAGPMVYAYNASEIHDSQNGNGYVNTISGTTFYWQGGQSGSYVATSSSAVTPSQIQTALQGQTNCNTDNLHWYSPFSGTCAPDTAVNITNLLKTLTGCNIDGSHTFAPFLGQCVLSSQVYPGAGVALSTGSAWGTSLTPNGTFGAGRGVPSSPSTSVTSAIAAYSSIAGDLSFDQDSAIVSLLHANYIKLQTVTGPPNTGTYLETVVEKQGLFGQNIMYSGTAWNMDDTSQAAAALRLNDDSLSGASLNLIPAGSGNPVSCIDNTCVAWVAIPGNKIYYNPGSVTATFPTNAIQTINPPQTIDNLTETMTTSRAATHKVRVDQAFTGQTANIYEVQDSTGAVLNGFDHLGNLISSSSPAWVQTDVTGSRSVNTIVTNGTHNITISGSIETTGSGTGTVTCLTGVSSPPTFVAWKNEATATLTNGSAGFVCDVPANWFYEIVPSGAVDTVVQSWIQTQK